MTSPTTPDAEAARNALINALLTRVPLPLDEALDLVYDLDSAVRMIGVTTGRALAHHDQWIKAGRPTHQYAGHSKARAEKGLPGHCERCCEVGHITAHPSLGCGDVDCTKAHPEDTP